MSYEYKDEIKELIYNNLDKDLNKSFNMRDEINHVYAQAAEYKEYRADTEKLYNALKAKGEREIQKYKSKADEYEAKAKAWDRMQDLLKDCTRQSDASGEWDTNWCAFENGIDEIIDEYESGERNES